MVELKHSFPDSFFEEEDRLGFHIDRKRKEIWAVELDMLYELDRVCKKLNIRYFLDGGTLLGAARDGHFIPWDDDIDVAMLRKDYDRFVHEAPKEFKFPIFLQTGYTEKGYFRGHCQLRNSKTCAILPEELGKVSFNQGIFIDIFVLDYVFEERLIVQYQAKRHFIRHVAKTLYSPVLCNSPVKKIKHFFQVHYYKRKYPDEASLYADYERVFRSEQESEYVDYLMLNRRAEQVHYLCRDWYHGTVFLPFEGALFPAPNGFREYLEAYYGNDWMTPRNVDSMHNAKGQVIYDTDRSYTEVIKEKLG